VSAIQIGDPNRHVLFTCVMLDGQQACHETFYAPSTSTVVKFEGPPTSSLPNDAGDAVHEELGKQQIAGMETVGTHDSTTYNPGVFGNDSAITVEREYWFSQPLGINLLSKRIDPRFGTQTFTINEVSISEPEAHLFDLPKALRSSIIVARLREQATKASRLSRAQTSSVRFVCAATRCTTRRRYLRRPQRSAKL